MLGARIVFGLLFISISALFLVQNPPNPLLGQVEHADKWAHGLLFLLLAASLQFAFRPPVWLGWVLLLGYGICIELVQHYVPGRVADIWDVVADMAGVSLFYLLRAAWLWWRKGTRSR